MNQQNFGLSGSKSTTKHHQEEFDTFLDGLFNNPERKAHRAERKELNLDKKRADINRKNAEAQAMLSIANDTESHVSDVSNGSTTMTYAIAGGLLLVCITGAIVIASKSKKRAAIEHVEAPLESLSNGLGEAIS
jgi:roadblock/LC7 domain-containing protein